MYENIKYNELKEIALQLAKNNEWGDTAIEVNNRIIENGTNYVPAYTRLAKCLLEKGDAAGALSLYNRVVELDPENKIANNHLKSIRYQVERERKEKEKVKLAEINKIERDKKKKKKDTLDTILKSIF